MARDSGNARYIPVTPPRDRVTMAITVAAILLFVGTAGATLSLSVQRFVTGGRGPDAILTAVLLLNVALILLGWRRDRTRAAPADRAPAPSDRDLLTGMLNRRGLIDQGSEMIGAADKRGKTTALLLLDLDRFRGVNDRHGHEAGDALLKLVAVEIAAAMPALSLVARIESDTFACALLFDANRPDTVDRVAERLVSRLAQPLQAAGLRLHLSASVGIAGTDRGLAGIDALLRAAGVALQAASSAGGNRSLWFEPWMQRDLDARGDFETALRAAVAQHEIVPYFEQQIDLATGRLVGFEMLARWHHPTHGVILPEAFIHIAEAIGLIGDLSLPLLRRAFLTAKDWDAGLALSVNLSPAQLTDAWLAQKIIKLLTETGFPPERLEIEITEAALFDNLALAQSTLGSLKNHGVRLALDDFGTGYSSIAHLRALPFDRLKIDHGCVMAIDRDPECAAIVTAIARLGESLNLPITAEGVADAGIEERVRALGCTRGQGHLYGLPTSAMNVRRLLAEKRLLAVQEPTRLAG